jgi:hypothetical protein
MSNCSEKAKSNAIYVTFASAARGDRKQPFVPARRLLLLDRLTQWAKEH